MHPIDTAVPKDTAHMRNLCEITASKSNMPVEATVKVCREFVETIQELLLAGKTVTIRNFGSLQPVTKKGRTVNYFGRGSKEIPDNKGIKLKISSSFKERLNDN